MPGFRVDKLGMGMHRRSVVLVEVGVHVDSPGDRNFDALPAPELIGARDGGDGAPPRSDSMRATSRPM
jgi:hypothetical protein